MELGKFITVVTRARHFIYPDIATNNMEIGMEVDLKHA
jgi:hypothetical protein